jgi:ABC-2 type transport system ATP-binding protein
MVEVRELVKAIAKEGRTVFVSSHLLFEVEQVCTHVTIINRGEALVSDTLQNVSSKISGPVTLQVEVAKLSNAIINAVKKLPFVAEVAQSGNTLSIDLKTHDDVRPQVSQEITKVGGVIVSMNLQRQSLENVFMQLISKQQGGKA